MKQFLQEVVSRDMKLVESTSPESTHKGCLGTMRGPCADFVSPTRNGNFYSRKLWENVFKDPLVVESLEDRVLIGELDHPNDGRLETEATNAAIVMTDYSFDDENGTLNGSFDILNTPNGKILKSLLDYGCKIGVSSRGEGDVTTKDGIDTVDEDTYYFVAFDAVVLPAVKKAKPTLAESLKRQTLKESIGEQIASAKTKGELECIKKVLESTKMPELDSLMESIDIRSKELEGINDSSNLMEDLENLTKQNQGILTENKELKQEVINCKSRIKRLLNSRSKSETEMEGQKEKFEALKSKYNKLQQDFNESSSKVKRLESQIIESVEVSKTLDKKLRTNGSLKEKQQSEISKLKESLEKKTKDQKSQETFYEGKIKSLKREHKSKVESLQYQYDAKIRSLEESLEKSQQVSREKSETIRELQENLKEVKSSTNKQLQESKEKIKKAQAKVNEAMTKEKESALRTQEVLESYINNKAKTLGFNPTKILESVKSRRLNQTEVDKLINEEVDRLDRYRKLPTTNDSLLNALSENSTVKISSMKPNEEDLQTKTFMEQVYNMKG